MSDGPLTLDSTAPLAGDTLLICPDSPDPEASRWFAGTINWLCNRQNIAFAKPPDRLRKVTPLLHAWRQVAAKGQGAPASRKKLSDAEKQSKFTELPATFLAYAESDAARIRRWLRYQLCNDTYTGIFWGGGNRTADLECARLALSTLQTSSLKQQIRIEPDEIAQETAERVHGDIALEDLPLAYTYLAFVKGSVYASESCVYAPHWLREKAATSPGTLSDGASTNPEWFPWGDLFEELYRDPRWHPDPDAFAEGLVRLRAETLSYQPVKVLDRYNSVAVARRELTQWVESQLRNNYFLPGRKHVLTGTSAEMFRNAGGKAIAIVLASQILKSLAPTASEMTGDFTELLLEVMATRLMVSVPWTQETWLLFNKWQRKRIVVEQADTFLKSVTGKGIA
jgi:hypothetical protein